MKKIIFLRHAQTEANDRHLYCGTTDLPLSENGIEALCKLKTDFSYPDISGFQIYTSGMKRAEDTLRILYGNVIHEIEAGLREVDFGDFEMHSYEELKEDPLYREWCAGDNRCNIPPDGESGLQMESRVWKAFSKLAEENENIVLVFHGGPIAFLMEKLFSNEGKNRYEWQPKNGCGYYLTFHNEQWEYRRIPEGI